MTVVITTNPSPVPPPPPGSRFFLSAIFTVTNFLIKLFFWSKKLTKKKNQRRRMTKLLCLSLIKMQKCKKQKHWSSFNQFGIFLFYQLIIFLSFTITTLNTRWNSFLPFTSLYLLFFFVMTNIWIKSSIFFLSSFWFTQKNFTSYFTCLFAEQKKQFSILSFPSFFCYIFLFFSKQHLLLTNTVYHNMLSILGSNRLLLKKQLLITFI